MIPALVQEGVLQPYRRRLCLAAAASAVVAAAARAGAPSPAPAQATQPPQPPQPPDRVPRLDRTQSGRCRDWMALVIRAQIERGPNPRWTHRDCAGLVRFAVDEALRPHDADWKRANGFLGVRAPADVEVDDATRQRLRQSWRRADGSRGAFVPALDLVQENTRWVSRELGQAEEADLLFFDLGDEQHLMVWMGHYVAYHTGRSVPGDNGLRALRPGQLLAWNDTRWRPTSDNPNFAGVYRLDFLA
jgi:uncharacterized protein YfaT (DUF1175 family)